MQSGDIRYSCSSQPLRGLKPYHQFGYSLRLNHLDRHRCGQMSGNTEFVHQVLWHRIPQTSGAARYPASAAKLALNRQDAAGLAAY
ncbi:Uncharacterised protein [Vibrio cholerae]|nr:Uncharacterised protein [Vibrio cholerae]